MSEVASRELRNSTRSLLDRVEAGETLTITVDGRPTAVLAPIGRRPRWVPRSEFASTVLAHQADPGLVDDLRALAGEMTDELPLP
jgi:prevent-host-death family protein